MDLGLENKVVIVTGGSKGIGLSCARAFLAEGARVGIVSRSPDNIAGALRELPGAIGATADLVDPEAAERALDELEAALGPVDILVNSAGAARRTPPDDLRPAVWRAAMDSKFFSYINMIDPAIKRMAARGTGVVVNVIGAGGKVAAPTHIAGGSANAALQLATAGLATAYAGRGIRVVAISPGLTETTRVDEGFRAQAAASGISMQEARTRAVARIPMGRAADPGEIANMVVFAASGKASYLTGVSIVMDGATNPVVV
ncbi:SDR family oxidoreductase [Zhengella sp. ZM62]|uniref:SDR family oxidoreductase n=1 Tax=Zhengella sedimenti TaxID=3390035 RepID=UPI00397579F2